MILPGAKMWAGHSCPGSFLLILPLLFDYFCCRAGDAIDEAACPETGRVKSNDNGKVNCNGGGQECPPTHGWLSGAAGSGAGQHALARLPGNDAEFLLDGRKALKNFMQT